MGASPGALDLTIPASAIDGTVPEALRGGRMFSNGPGWTRIGDRTAHPFDGHGYMRSFTLLPDGGCRLRAAFVQTPSYRVEREAGRLVHRGLATNASPHFWKNIQRTPARNVANTTVIRRGDRLLAGWEAGAPYALDPDTLETHGEEHFGGVIAGAATLAHMRRDATRGRLTLCSVGMGRDTTFTFRELDDADQVVTSRVVEVGGMVFTHDYGLAPSWYVLGGNPLRLKPLEMARALAGAGTMLHAIAPDGARPGALHLVPRGGDGPLRTVTLPEPVFIVHFGNSFERAGDLIVDICALDAFEFGEEFGYQGPDRPFDPALPEARGPQRLLRVTVPAGSDTATWERLSPHGVDFPRFHPDHEGVPTPRLFGATRRDTRFSDPFDSIIGVDLLDPEHPAALWTTGPDEFVGEPLFAPDPAHPEQGHVLALVSNGRAQQTTLVVLDAGALDAGPVARVPMPLLPIAFHGEWEAPT